MTLSVSAQMILKDPNFPQHLNISASSISQFEALPKSIASRQSALSTASLNLFGTQAQQDAIRQYGIAGRVWEASYALSLYIHPPLLWEFMPPFSNRALNDKPMTIIELGSGSGMVASHLADILDLNRDLLIATDLPEVCPLLAKVFSDRNGNQDPIYVRPLAWGRESHIADIASEFFRDNKRAVGCLTHIICSDLIYFPELLAPLLRTLLHLSSPPFVSLESRCATQNLSIIISYQVRSLLKETPFWSAFGLWFEFEPVLYNDQDLSHGWQRLGSTLGDDMFIFIARRRGNSFGWNIPANDLDLLGGVGAQNTDMRKEDDKFESLLLMSLEL